jgi:hypothetical protein
MKAIVIAFYGCLSTSNKSNKKDKSVNLNDPAVVKRNIATALLLGTGWPSGSLLNIWASGLLRVL